MSTPFGMYTAVWCAIYVFILLRRFTLTGIAGTPVTFNENGDAPGRYEIYQYQMHNGTPEYKVIGQWADHLHIKVRKKNICFSLFSMWKKNNDIILSTV